MVKTVVYASDGRDSSNLAMSAWTVRQFIGPETRIVVLTDLDRYPGQCDAETMNPSSLLEDAGLHPRGWNRKWPFATLYRLALPLMESISGRVLYLDTDTLVRSGRALRLFEAPAFRREILGVPEPQKYCSGRISKAVSDIGADARSELESRFVDLESLKARKYINAGVTVWDLDFIRDNGLEWYLKRLSWFWAAECRGRFPFLDQDFMNSLMDVGPFLPEEFNCWDGKEDSGSAIQHFVSGRLKGKMKKAFERIVEDEKKRDSLHV